MDKMPGWLGWTIIAMALAGLFCAHVYSLGVERMRLDARLSQALPGLKRLTESERGVLYDAASNCGLMTRQTDAPATLACLRDGAQAFVEHRRGGSVVVMNGDMPVSMDSPDSTVLHYGTGRQLELVIEKAK